MAFPVEGWAGSAAADVREADGTINVRYTTVGDPDDDALRRQVARCLSLDPHGTGGPAGGRRDPVIGRLQERHEYLRPVCFYSAYEAATSFVIGQRIARVQASRVKARLSGRAGAPLTPAGPPFT